MLKNIDPSDKSIRPFKVHKKWFLNQNDSGSGFLRLNAESGSLFNFNTGTVLPHNHSVGFMVVLPSLNMVHIMIDQIGLV